MTTIQNSDLPTWSKQYHERIEGNRDLSEPTSSIMKREYGVEANFSHALKPGECLVQRDWFTHYSG